LLFYTSEVKHEVRMYVGQGKPLRENSMKIMEEL